MNGKGSRNRTSDYDAYRSGYDEINWRSRADKCALRKREKELNHKEKK